MPTVISKNPQLTRAVNDEEPLWRQRELADAREGKICRICLGLGWTRDDVPVGHENFGTLQRCACYKQISDL